MRASIPAVAHAGVLLLNTPGVRQPDGTGARVLVGLPAGNSGAVAYFNASEGPSKVSGTLGFRSSIEMVQLPRPCTMIARVTAGL